MTIVTNAVARKMCYGHSTLVVFNDGFFHAAVSLHDPCKLQGLCGLVLEASRRELGGGCLPCLSAAGRARRHARWSAAAEMYTPCLFTMSILLELSKKHDIDDETVAEFHAHQSPWVTFE